MNIGNNFGAFNRFSANQNQLNKVQTKKDQVEGRETIETPPREAIKDILQENINRFGDGVSA